MKRALVTGGAGLIGSHVTDLLVREGWKVRVLDNLEPNTHKRGKPAWINPNAEFLQGDIRDRDTVTAALDKIDIVFHQAAYGGYMPEIAKYVQVNSFGTAQMLEVIREKNLPINKIIVASSQAVYYRNRERGPLHAPEFTMLEWYRVGEPYDAAIEDCVAIVRLAAEAAGTTRFHYRGREADIEKPPERISVADAFREYATIDLLASLASDGAPDRDAFARAAAAAGVKTG